MHALVLTLIATALYLAAAGILALPLLHRQAQPRALGLGLAALAVIGHFAVLVGAHRGGVDLHFFAALSLVGACVAALCLIVNLSRPVATLGVIVFPLAALLLGVDMFFAPATQPLPASPSASDCGPQSFTEKLQRSLLPLSFATDPTPPG